MININNPFNNPQIGHRAPLYINSNKVLFAYPSPISSTKAIWLAPYTTPSDDPMLDPVDHPNRAYYDGCILAPVKEFDPTKIYSNKGTIIKQNGVIYRVQTVQTATVPSPNIFSVVGYYNPSLQDDFYTNYDVSQYGIPTSKETCPNIAILAFNGTATQGTFFGGLQNFNAIDNGQNAQLVFKSLFYTEWAYYKDMTEQEALAMASVIESIVGYGYNARKTTTGAFIGNTPTEADYYKLRNLNGTMIIN